MESNLKYSVERWLKKNLKNKISITKSIVISYLMTGLISMSTTLVVTNGTNMPTAQNDNTIAIGNGASAGTSTPKAGDNAIAIGVSSVAMGLNSVGIGKEAKSIGNDSIAIGNNAKTLGTGSMALGLNALASRDSIAIGLNTNLDKARQSYAIGTALEVSGNYNIVYGSGPNWDNSAVIAGDSNVAIGANNYIFSDTSRAQGILEKYGEGYRQDRGGYTVNLSSLSKDNILVGAKNILGRSSEANMILGANNVAIKDISNSSYLLESGWSEAIKSADIDSKSGKIIGTYVLGNKNRLVSESKNNLILGSSNTVQGGVENSIVLGNNVDAKVSNSVYIGNKSVATIEANDITAGEKGAPGKVTVGTHDFVFAGAGETGIGVITVGRVENGKSVGRIIQNLAPGLISKNSTDAVNGSQLYAVVTVINDKFSTKEYTNQQINNATYNLRTGTDGNMVYTLDNKKVSKLGDSFYLSENVKDVVWLNDKYYDKNTAFDGNGNLKQDATELNLNDAKYGKLTDDQVQVLKISTVNSNGTTTNPVTITNLKNGLLTTDSKEAVNGSQLYKLSNDILGVSIENNDYKGLTFSNITTGSGEKSTGTTFKSAIDTLIDVANTGNKFKANGKADTITLPVGGTLNFNSDNLKVSVDKDSNTVNIDNPYFKNSYTGTPATITSGTSSLVIGSNSTSSASNTIVIGKDSSASSSGSVLIGSNISGNNEKIIALGNDIKLNENSNNRAIVIGNSIDHSTREAELNDKGNITKPAIIAGTNFNDTITIGNNALATGDGSIAIGSYKGIYGEPYSVAYTTGTASIAIGQARALNNFSIAIGYQANVSDTPVKYMDKQGVEQTFNKIESALVIGRNASVHQSHGVVIGSNSFNFYEDDPLPNSLRIVNKDGTYTSYTPYVPVSGIDYKYNQRTREFSVGGFYKRVVTNVAPGFSDYDAVNVMQLKTLSNQTIKLNADGNTSTKAQTLGENGGISFSILGTSNEINTLADKDSNTVTISLNDTFKNSKANVDASNIASNANKWRTAIDTYSTSEIDGKVNGLAEKTITFKTDDKDTNNVTSDITKKLGETLTILGGGTSSVSFNDDKGKAFSTENVRTYTNNDGNIYVTLAKESKFDKVTLNSEQTTAENNDLITKKYFDTNQKEYEVTKDTNSSASLTIDASTQDKKTTYTVKLDETKLVDNIKTDSVSDSPTGTKLTTESAVKNYVENKLSNLSTSMKFDGNEGGEQTLDLKNGKLSIVGKTGELKTTSSAGKVEISLDTAITTKIDGKVDKTELTTLKSSGIKFSGNDSNEITLPLGDKLNIVGDITNSNNFKSATDNILIEGNATDKKLTVKLSENLKNINSIDIKDSTTPDSKKVTLSSDKDGNLQILKDSSTSPSKIVTDDRIGSLTSSINLKYNVNSSASDSKMVSLSDGLDFTNGTNTTAEILDKGVVKFNLNKTLKDLDSVSIKGTNGKETVLSSDENGNLVVVNGKDGTNGINPTSSKVVTENTIGNLTSSINLTYKANSATTSKTVSLSDGLNFTNGSNTTAEVGDNGVVKFNLVKDITSINSISGGDSNKSKINLKDNSITLENDGKNLTISKDTNGMKVTGLEERNLESQDFGVNDNKNRAATEGAVQYIAEKLGLTNNSGTAQGNSGPAGKDGLNGKSIIDKVESLRNGLAGNQVFTDENGNRVVKEGDKYYLANEDGTKKDPAEEIPSNKLVTSLVNPDGTTSTPTVLNNVGSGLGLNQATPLTKEEAQKAINGTDGLLEKSGSELNKAANLVDLQALAQAGLDFTTNKKNGVEHRPLGSSIAIIGKNVQIDDYTNYSSDNLITNITDDNKIQISMLKTPILEGLKLGNETDNIALEKDADGSLKLVKTPDNNGDDKVALKGIKEGNSEDSVATKGSVDALKEALGLGENNTTQSTTGPAGKDGLNGKSILDKVQSLRDGLAGNQVFTDKDGNRVMKDKDGKYYLSDENGEKKNPVTEIQPENIVISSVNPDGSTTNPIVMNNVGSGLGANTSTSALTPEQAKELLSGKDGNNGLLGMSGNSLNKAANLSDLQALAQAGINFKGNDSKEVHIPLSKTLEITGEGSTVDGFTSSSGNILVVKDDSKDGLVVKLSEDLKNIKNITLKGTNGKDAVLSSDENGNLVVANGKDGANGTNVAPSKVVTENTISGLTSSINLTYKANNSTDSKTVSLSKGLDFTNGTNTTSEIGDNGVVKFNLNKDLKDLESITIKGKDGKEAILSTDNDGNLVVVNGKDGTNGQTLQPSKVATATDLDKLKEELGIAKDDTTSNGSTGTAGKDGLDGKSLSEKIDAIRNGLAGNQVYTDKDGNRLVQGKDGKYYKEGSLDKDGMPTNGAQEIPSKDIVASLVNPDGSTTDTIVLNNVGSSLGAETKDKPLESKDAKELVAGTNGLLSMKGNDLNKAANLSDLQALAQAGLDFAGNVGETHQTLGSKLSIVGKENVTDFNNYSTDNVATNVTNGKVEIGILKTPTFESVKVGTETNNIKLSDDNGALKLTKSTADASVENSDKVVLTGIKDGTTSDSAVTKGALDDLKSTLGLNGTNGTPSTTGPAGKDGLDGKSILDKVQALRDGLSGNQVFTDKDGNRVVKDGDKYYLADENGNKETPEKEIQPNELVTSLVNPDGTTKTPTVLNNVGSGLGLNQTAPLTKEEAQKAINGVNGNDGLLSMQGKDLNKAANLQDLQALAQAGLDFAGNVGNDIHKTLGSKLSIVGKDGTVDFANYSTDNVATNVANGKVEIGILKTPTFESIKVGSGTDNITLSDDGGALKLTKTPDTNGDDKVVLKGIKDGNTPDSVATKGALDEVKSALGLDKNYEDPTTGISAQDGLNGKTILEKIDAIRDGLAGNQVYVDPATGERLVKGNDGNLYKASELGKDGEPINGAKPVDNPMIALVNPDGTTSNPTVLGNVGSGLGADTSTAALTPEKAKELVSGTNGLLGKSGNELNKAANLSDLQALAQAGLDFEGNVGDATHQTLGSKLSIVGKDGTKDFTNYSTDNVATKVSDGKIEIGILKTPTFENIKVGDENENITLGKDTDGALKLTKSPLTPDDKDSDKVVLKGIKDGDTPDSVATKGALDKVKEELGLNGKNNSTITVGPAGKDGLNGETILNKIDALRNGLAGNQVFTDKDGNRVVLDPADGKYYQADENGKKIEPAKEIPSNELVTSLVNPDGTTKTPTVLSNVGSGLGAETSTASLTPEQAKNLVSGQDGKSGLLTMKGNELNKAANLSDLQALAQAGLDFTTNKKDGVEHRTLGSSIAIIGKDTVVDNYDGYSSENLITNITDNKIQISMLKTPTFESVKVGDGTNNITLGKDADGSLKLSKEPVANGDDKVVLKGIKDGDTEDSVATKGALDKVKSELGLDGKYTDPTTGISAKDGLNGKTILEKIDAIRDGLAGNQVYVDPVTGEKLAKGNDGKLYKVSDLTDGVPNPNAQPVDNPMIALVNPDGTTSNPTVLGNVGSGLGLNTAAPLTKEEAQKAINGVNGNDGLLSMKGNELNKAANLSDLQALAQAGLDFAGNVGETHQTLGSKLSVIGKDGIKDFNNYSTDNVATKVSDGKIEIGILKTPTFENIKVGDGTNNITLGKDADGSLKLSKEPVANGDDKVVLKGIKDGDTPDSVATKGALDKVKSELGLDGKYTDPTTGISAKDGLNGKTILEKIDAIRDGLAGNQVYVDPATGEKLAKGNDGKLYKVSDLTDGVPNQNATPVDNPMIALVNPDGSTSNPTVLGNVGSGLGADTKDSPLTAEKAKELVAGANGLLGKSGNELNKAANLSDLQALAQAGLDFTTNKKDGVEHRTLGSTIAIIGKDTVVENYDDYSADNLITNITDDGKIQISMLKTPTFESIKVGDGTNNITLGKDTDGSLKLSKEPDTSGDDKVVLKGIKDGDTPDSVATKGALDKVKSELGLDGKYTDPTTGISAKDGLNGKTILEKIDALRDGLAGNQVYVDPATGEKLVKGNDGKLYKASDLTDGVPNTNAKPVDNPMIALVNPDGTTSNPTVLGNVGSGLGADTKDSSLTADKAKELVSGTNGLLSMKGNELNKAANLSDLQALAQAGLDFAGNVGETHQTLGSKLSIVGKDGINDFSNYSANNIATNVIDGKIVIGMLENPTFNNIYLTSPKGNIADEDYATGDNGNLAVRRSEVKDLIEKGIKVKTEDKKEFTVKLGGTLEIVGENNTSTTKGNKVDVNTPVVVAEETPTPDSTNNNVVSTVEDNRVVVRIKDRPEFETVIIKNDAKIEDGSQQVVSGNQLYKANKDVADILGMELAEDGSIQNNGFEINGKKYDNLKDSLSMVDKSISSIKEEISINKSLGDAGIASAIATASIPQVIDKNRPYSIGAGTGIYKGQGAVAVGVSGTNKTGSIVFKASGAVNTSGELSAGAGLAYTFGTTYTPSLEIEKDYTGVFLDDAYTLKLIDQAIKEHEKPMLEEIARLNDKISTLEDQITNLKNSKVRNKLFVYDKFSFDKYELSNNHLNELKELAEYINSSDNIEIEIKGFTDVKGKEDYNLKLGLNRAYAIFDKLVEYGVDRSKIRKVSSSGYNEIVSTNDSNSNRRVEILVIETLD